MVFSGREVVVQKLPETEMRLQDLPSEDHQDSAWDLETEKPMAKRTGRLVPSIAQ